MTATNETDSLAFSEIDARLTEQQVLEQPEPAQQSIPGAFDLSGFTASPQDRPRPALNPMPQPAYVEMGLSSRRRQEPETTVRSVFEILGTVLAVCASICLFIMMVLLIGSYQPESFIPAALAVLATSVITSCGWYWATKFAK